MDKVDAVQLGAAGARRITADEPMICSIQEFVEAITEELRCATSEVREEFRRAWWAQVIERERTRENDRRFLRSVGIDPDGD